MRKSFFLALMVVLVMGLAPISAWAQFQFNFQGFTLFEKLVSVDGGDNADDYLNADTPTGPEITVGETVYFGYKVMSDIPMLGIFIFISDPPLIPGLPTGDANDNGFLDPDEVWFYQASATAVAGQQSSTATISALGFQDTDIAYYFGVAPPESGLVQVAVEIDIRPGSCPNPFNARSKGVVPVAIVGSQGFAVSTIDPTSVKLEDVAPLKWKLEDTTMPSTHALEDCDDCNGCEEEFCGDGFLDLVLHFDIQELVANSDAIAEAARGDCVTLTLTGAMLDGTPILGLDSVVIRTKIKAAPSNTTLTTRWGSLKTE